MSQKNKLLGFGMLILGALLFSGCGRKENVVQNQITPVPQKTEKQATEPKKNIEQENLPVPTGKVSDTLDAINSEVDSEKNVIFQEDQDAQGAVDDKSEVDDFGAAYNENEL